MGQLRNMLGILSILAIFATSGAKATYVPGTPGIQWTEDQASIIQAKIVYLFEQKTSIINKFDKMLGGNGAVDADYVFDPTKRLSTKDCNTDGQCESAWNSRKGSIMFNEPKAVRLAFHDCMPYEDGGGCDGCLNFEANEDEHNVLQHTVAILEKLYLEKDFPSMNGPNLEASPKDLGMSRADLWAFTSLVALDEVQNHSRDLCQTMQYNLTCNDWSTPCWSKFHPGHARKMFVTGRSDCIPSSTATSKQGYLASKVEIAPDQNANGPKTAQYFKDNFNMKPKEALALMGAHTIGRYSGFQTHIDYAWVRAKHSVRNEVFNTEYFQTLAARPMHTKDKYCVGTMDGGNPTHYWNVRAELFEFYWPQPAPWISKHRRLMWNHLVERGPVCDKEDEDYWGDAEIFWNIEESDVKADKAVVAKFKQLNTGHPDFWSYCCEQKANKCWENNSCDPDCTRKVQNRIRHLSSDVGFYLKWETDQDGYPHGCDAFKDMKGGLDNDWQWLWTFRTDGDKANPQRIAGCPVQDMDDGYGQQMYKTVEKYADNQQLWIRDFIKVWIKMSQNGYGSKELVQGPKNFWTHF